MLSNHYEGEDPHHQPPARWISLSSLFTGILVLGVAAVVGQNILFNQKPTQSIAQSGYVKVSPDRLGELFAAVDDEAGAITSRTTHLSVEPDTAPRQPASLNNTPLINAQSDLIYLGHLSTGAVTGELDEATKEAILRFEAEQGLVPDGKLDEETVERLSFLRRIKEASGPEAPLDENSVTKVQRGLAALGYRPGPVDGVFGEATKAAIIQFQQDRGLPSDGSIDERLLAELDQVAVTRTQR